MPSRRSTRRRAAVAGWTVGIAFLLACLAVFAALLPRLVRGAFEVPAGTAHGQRLVSRYPDVVFDQGNTVRLRDGRTLWIFADTVQDEGDPQFFVTSSAAVTEPGSVFLHFATDRRGAPREFLPRTAAERAQSVPGKRYVAVWPTGATTLPDGRVLVAYTKYVVDDDPLRFSFRAAGLYAWTPPRDGDVTGSAPARRVADDLWGVGDGAVASPVAAGRYVYFTQCEDGRCYSLRTPVADLAVRDSYRWWTGTTWSPRRLDRRPMVYGSDHPGRNPPTAYLPAAGVFATVDTSGGIQASTARVWVAPRPWGPWSAAATFTLPGCTRTDGCYTLNLHPDASTARSLRVSYATAHDGPHVHVVDVPVRIAPGATEVTVASR